MRANNQTKTLTVLVIITLIANASGAIQNRFGKAHNLRTGSNKLHQKRSGFSQKLNRNRERILKTNSDGEEVDAEGNIITKLGDTVPETYVAPAHDETADVATPNTHDASPITNANKSVAPPSADITGQTAYSILDALFRVSPSNQTAEQLKKNVFQITPLKSDFDMSTINFKTETSESEDFKKKFGFVDSTINPSENEKEVIEMQVNNQSKQVKIPYLIQDDQGEGSKDLLQLVKWYQVDQGLTRYQTFGEMRSFDGSQYVDGLPNLDLQKLDLEAKPVSSEANFTTDAKKVKFVASQSNSSGLADELDLGQTPEKVTSTVMAGQLKSYFGLSVTDKRQTYTYFFGNKNGFLASQNIEDLCLEVQEQDTATDGGFFTGTNFGEVNIVYEKADFTKRENHSKRAEKFMTEFKDLLPREQHDTALNAVLNTYQAQVERFAKMAAQRARSKITDINKYFALVHREEWTNKFQITLEKLLQARTVLEKRESMSREEIAKAQVDEAQKNFNYAVAGILDLLAKSGKEEIEKITAGLEKILNDDFKSGKAFAYFESGVGVQATIYENVKVIEEYAAQKYTTNGDGEKEFSILKNFHDQTGEQPIDAKVHKIVKEVYENGLSIQQAAVEGDKIQMVSQQVKYDSLPTMVRYLVFQDYYRLRKPDSEFEKNSVITKDTYTYMLERGQFAFRDVKTMNYSYADDDSSFLFEKNCAGYPFAKEIAEKATGVSDEEHKKAVEAQNQTNNLRNRICEHSYVVSLWYRAFAEDSLKNNIPEGQFELFRKNNEDDFAAEDTEKVDTLGKFVTRVKKGKGLKNKPLSGPHDTYLALIKLMYSFEKTVEGRVNGGNTDPANKIYHTFIPEFTRGDEGQILRFDDVYHNAVEADDVYSPEGKSVDQGKKSIDITNAVVENANGSLKLIQAVYKAEGTDNDKKDQDFATHVNTLQGKNADDLRLSLLSFEGFLKGPRNYPGDIILPPRDPKFVPPTYVVPRIGGKDPLGNGDDFVPPTLEKHNDDPTVIKEPRSIGPVPYEDTPKQVTDGGEQIDPNVFSDIMKDGVNRVLVLCFNLHQLETDEYKFDNVHKTFRGYSRIILEQYYTLTDDTYLKYMQEVEKYCKEEQGNYTVEEMLTWLAFKNTESTNYFTERKYAMWDYKVMTTLFGYGRTQMHNTLPFARKVSHNNTMIEQGNDDKYIHFEKEEAEFYRQNIVNIIAIEQGTSAVGTNFSNNLKKFVAVLNSEHENVQIPKDKVQCSKIRLFTFIFAEEERSINIECSETADVNTMITELLELSHGDLDDMVHHLKATLPNYYFVHVVGDDSSACLKSRDCTIQQQSYKNALGGSQFNVDTNQRLLQVNAYSYNSFLKKEIAANGNAASFKPWAANEEQLLNLKSLNILDDKFDTSKIYHIDSLLSSHHDLIELTYTPQFELDSGIEYEHQFYLVNKFLFMGSLFIPSETGVSNLNAEYSTNVEFNLTEFKFLERSLNFFLVSNSKITNFDTYMSQMEYKFKSSKSAKEVVTYIMLLRLHAVRYHALAGTLEETADKHVNSTVAEKGADVANQLKSISDHHTTVYGDGNFSNILKQKHGVVLFFFAEYEIKMRQHLEDAEKKYTLKKDGEAYSLYKNYVLIPETDAWVPLNIFLEIFQFEEESEVRKYTIKRNDESESINLENNVESMKNYNDNEIAQTDGENSLMHFRIRGKQHLESFEAQDTAQEKRDNLYYALVTIDYLKMKDKSFKKDTEKQRKEIVDLKEKEEQEQDADRKKQMTETIGEKTEIVRQLCDYTKTVSKRQLTDMLNNSIELYNRQAHFSFVKKVGDSEVEGEILKVVNELTSGFKYEEEDFATMQDYSQKNIGAEEGDKLDDVIRHYLIALTFQAISRGATLLDSRVYYQTNQDSVLAALVVNIITALDASFMDKFNVDPVVEVLKLNLKSSLGFETALVSSNAYGQNIPTNLLGYYKNFVADEGLDKNEYAALTEALMATHDDRCQYMLPAISNTETVEVLEKIVAKCRFLEHFNITYENDVKEKVHLLEDQGKLLRAITMYHGETVENSVDIQKHFEFVWQVAKVEHKLDDDKDEKLTQFFDFMNFAVFFDFKLMKVQIEIVEQFQEFIEQMIGNSLVGVGGEISFNTYNLSNNNTQVAQVSNDNMNKYLLIDIINNFTAKSAVQFQKKLGNETFVQLLTASSKIIEKEGTTTFELAKFRQLINFKPEFEFVQERVINTFQSEESQRISTGTDQKLIEGQFQLYSRSCKFREEFDKDTNISPTTAKAAESVAVDSLQVIIDSKSKSADGSMTTFYDFSLALQMIELFNNKKLSSKFVVDSTQTIKARKWFELIQDVMANVLNKNSTQEQFTKTQIDFTVGELRNILIILKKDADITIPTEVFNSLTQAAEGAEGTFKLNEKLLMSMYDRNGLTKLDTKNTESKQFQESIKRVDAKKSRHFVL